MKKQILYILAAIGAVLPTYAAGEDAVIFSGSEGFREGWTATSWGTGLEVREDGKGEKDEPAVAAVPTDKVVPWSGLALRVGYDQNKTAAAIPLDDALREHGVVMVRLNCGKDRSGQPGAGQALQVSIGFLVGGNLKEVSPLPINQFGGSATLDGNPESWQEIRIPIATMLAKLPDPAAAEGILSVGLQYVEAPVCEILVSDCRVKAE